MNKPDTVDIGSWSPSPLNLLSNFARHPFVFESVKCNSMEGFLQSLKFEEPVYQRRVCLLIGKDAKATGKTAKNWMIRQKLYWRGKTLARDGLEYQLLLDEAYSALYEQNELFRMALEATKGKRITHSLGKSKTSKTVLTEKEFCDRLMFLREKGSMVERDASGKISNYLRKIVWP